MNSIASSRKHRSCLLHSKRRETDKGVRVEQVTCSLCSLHRLDLLLGGEAALDAGAYLGVRLAALVPDRLLKCTALALLAIPT